MVFYFLLVTPEGKLNSSFGWKIWKQNLIVLKCMEFPSGFAPPDTARLNATFYRRIYKNGRCSFCGNLKIWFDRIVLMSGKYAKIV